MEEEKKPVRKRKLADSVVERLNSMIYSGELKGGDRLPTERALAERMGVSRTVIRQAIQILADRDVLEIRHGCGYVRQTSFDEIIRNLSKSFLPDARSMQEIMEVRTLLEVFIVKKASENITRKKVQELQKNIDQMKKLMESGDNGSTLEDAFHRGLAEAADNHILEEIYNLCEGMLDSTQQSTWLGARISGSPNTAVEEHQAILDAVSDGDSQRAMKLMQKHMDYASSNLKKLLNSEKEQVSSK